MWFRHNALRLGSVKGKLVALARHLKQTRFMGPSGCQPFNASVCFIHAQSPLFCTTPARVFIRFPARFALLASPLYFDLLNSTPSSRNLGNFIVFQAVMTHAKTLQNPAKEHRPWHPQRHVIRLDQVATQCLSWKMPEIMLKISM